MSIFTNIEGDFESYWEVHGKPFLDEEVEPELKKFISGFTTTFGKQALTAALGAVASLAVPGASFGGIATGLATTLLGDATADAKTGAIMDATQLLQTVQSALQVAKVANNITTPADAMAASKLAITGEPAPSPAPVA